MSPSTSSSQLNIMIASSVHLAVIIYLTKSRPVVAWQSSKLMHKTCSIRPPTQTLHETSLFYKTIDQIDEQGQQQISSPSSQPPNPSDEGNSHDMPASVVSENILPTEGGHNFNPDDNDASSTSVEEANDWLSGSTRTLGSLFLRQEDADRDKNVDVFGRPLVSSTTPSDDGDGSDGDTALENNSKEDNNSFAQFMMNLKFQEEDERARSEAAQRDRMEQKVKGGGGNYFQNILTKRMQEDQKIAKELDDSVTKLSITSGEGLFNDLDVLPLGTEEVVSPKMEDKERDGRKEALLRLSYPEHYEGRIGRDMRHLAVSIAASIDKPWQWKHFFDEGGGVLPLLECIRDGARAVEQRKNPDFLDDGDVEGTASLVEQHEASFAAACTACRALRDLSALSKDFAAVVTDDILKVNEQWSTCVVEGNGYDCSSGGLISDLLILLKHANEAEAFYKVPRKGRPGSRRASFSLSTRRRRRDARKRCGLYVVQLMLAMVVASDQAVTTFRSTSGLIEEVVACSSFARSTQFKRKWVRKPVSFLKRIVPGRRKTQQNADSWVDSGLTGTVQRNANKLLAAIGHNEWVPKLPNQRGLRVLCLDGGGTRGIAAVTSLRHIVKAMNGVEVCDAFDMIVGTSTGAIVGFLVGLRRESAADARIRYDTLIKRIFVKSMIAPIMLATTTASYDETNIMKVFGEILKENGMLDSRANPAVPLITAVSSKMSSTPSQLCLFRNYNYGGGEMPDSFCIDPEKARERLGLEYDDVMESRGSYNPQSLAPIKCAPRSGKGSRYPGSFRVTQKIALRATTAAPTFFKPLLSFDELYVDGGIVAANPSAVAVHEARAVYPGVPLELVVSVGTGVFTEIKVPPKVGWDGVVAQILDSATDAEQVHHILEDVFGEDKTAQFKGTKMASTKYFRFNPVVGEPNSFPIDEIAEDRLQELCDIVDEYMDEDEQKSKLKQLGEVIHPKSWVQRAIEHSIDKKV